MLLSDLKGYGSSNSGSHQVRAIMDSYHPDIDLDVITDSKTDTTDLDEFGLERLPSIDFGGSSFQSSSSPGDLTTTAGNADVNGFGYSLLHNRLNGAELTSISSFDQCAARVSAPPLKHLASFDVSYFNSPLESFHKPSITNNNMNNIDNSSSSEAVLNDFVSDRVTLLADSSADDTSPSADFTLGKRKAGDMSGEVLEDAAQRPSSSSVDLVVPGSSSGPAPSSLRQSLEAEDTEQFIHLLNRNQNVSLHILYRIGIAMVV